MEHLETILAIAEKNRWGAVIVAGFILTAFIGITPLGSAIAAVFTGILLPLSKAWLKRKEDLHRFELESRRQTLELDVEAKRAALERTRAEHAILEQYRVGVQSAGGIACPRDASRITGKFRLLGDDPQYDPDGKGEP